MPEHRWELALSLDGNEAIIDPALHVGDRLVVLGSTVRGLLRHSAARLAASRGQQPACTFSPGGAGEAAECDCAVCVVFGTPARPGKLAVRSTTVERPLVRTVASVAIDRSTRTARRSVGSGANDGRSGGQLAAHATVSFADPIRIELRGRDLDDQQVRLVDDTLAWCELTGLAVGSRRTTGAGFLTVRVTNRQTLTPAIPDTAHVRSRFERSAQIGGRALAVLELEALEPWRLAGRVRRVFYRDVEPVVPPTTIAGALGWGLADQFGDETADVVFGSNPLRVGPGWFINPTDAITDPTPWQGRYRCRGSQRHEHDLGAALVLAAIGAGPFELACPDCGSSMKPLATTTPDPMVFGQTAIDRSTGRAADGQLRFQATVPVGARARAIIGGTPEQLALIAGLDEVLVGGNRRRGLGAARLRLEPMAQVAWPAGQPWAAEQLPPDNGGTPVVGVGFVTDAFCPTAVAEVAQNLGLEIAASLVRTVVRGGWDTRTNTPRPVRRLIRAGSWFAVRSQGDDPAELTSKVQQLVAQLEDGGESPSAVDRSDGAGGSAPATTVESPGGAESTPPIDLETPWFFPRRFTR